MNFPITKSNTASLKQALAQSQVQETLPGSGSVGYIKFNFKNGDFIFGKDAEDITGFEIAINTASIQHGWVLWVNNSCTKNLVPFNAPLPEPMASVGNNHPTEGRGFEARFLDEDDETVIKFETNTFGGRKGVDNLLREVMTKAVSSDFIFPIVKLESESYEAKTGGTIHNPVFKVVGWMDDKGQREGEAKAAIPAPAATQEESTPVRRRRTAA